MTTCPICQGVKTIRLPMRQQAAMFANDPIKTTLPYRTYPCPECVTGAADERLHIAGATTLARTSDLAHREAREATQLTTARALADYMLRHNLITFSERETGAFDTTEITARAAFVSPDRITPLERRVKQATAPAIQAVAHDAINRIDSWREQSGEITKRDAIRFVREAMRDYVK